MAETQEFTKGQMVRVKRLWSANHHRVPYYLKGKIGQIATCLGPVENPELSAYFKKSSDQHILYRVRFKHAHLWGGNQTDEIYADLAGKWLCKAEG
jgi:hypothetical protein